jgi:hypothetical protein
MKGTDQNGFGSIQVLEEKPQQIAASTPPPSANENTPLSHQKRRRNPC